MLIMSLSHSCLHGTYMHAQFVPKIPKTDDNSTVSVDVGRGSPSVGRVYGDVGNTVCVKTVQEAYPCAFLLCVLGTWTLLRVVSTL